jgi:hypothetical protein
LAGEDPQRTRRNALRYLAGSAAVFTLGGRALEAIAAPAHPARAPGEDEYDFIIARVNFPMNVRARGANWNVYPSGERYLLEEFTSVVRCKTKIMTNSSGQSPVHGNPSHFAAVVTLDDFENLRRFPFLFMTGEGAFKLSTPQSDNIKRYLEQGGFLLVDDCVFAPSGDDLYQSACAMLEHAFGTGSVVSIPDTHEVFHNVYDLSDMGLPHCQGKNHGARGVFLGDRMAVFLSSTDLHCGWADRSGEWFPNPALGIHGYREAIQMGVNILMYALSH